MVYNLRFFLSSKCSLFHNSNAFGSCIIHILYTGCAKIKEIIPAPKGLNEFVKSSSTIVLQIWSAVCHTLACVLESSS